MLCPCKILRTVSIFLMFKERKADRELRLVLVLKVWFIFDCHRAPCTLTPVCQTVLWGSCVCHFSSRSYKKWRLIILAPELSAWFFFNKGQEGNRKLSISWQAIHWFCRILIGIEGKEKRVCFNTSGSLSCLWSSAICYGFVTQAIVYFINRTDVEITKCLFQECGWIRSRWCYLDFYFVLWQWVKAELQCSCGEEQCWVQSWYSISAPESAR